jgi:UPF0716 family protein affecting phage T7 exclusion
MPLLLVIAEILLIYYFFQAFGFLNLFFFYAFTMVVGIMVLRLVGSQSLRQFQTGQVHQGNTSLVSQGLLFLSGLMMLVPSMITKIFGILFVLPPVRWLVALIFTGFLLKRVFNAGSFIHQFGNGSGGFKFYSSGASGNPFQNSSQEQNPQYDDNVIDANFRKIEDDPKLLK